MATPARVTDGHGRPENMARDIRRYAREHSLRLVLLKACRTGSSVVLVILGEYAAKFSGPEL
jgi:hypothetical protein